MHPKGDMIKLLHLNFATDTVWGTSPSCCLVLWKFVTTKCCLILQGFISDCQYIYRLGIFAMINYFMDPKNLRVHKYQAVNYTWSACHDDIIKWKYSQRYWPFVQGIRRSLMNSPHNGQWCRALMFSLIWAWTNGWVKNRDPGDLRCHRAHFDIIVMVAKIGYVISVVHLLNNKKTLLSNKDM